MPPVPFKRAYFIFLNRCTACRFDQFFFYYNKITKTIQNTTCRTYYQIKFNILEYYMKESEFDYAFNLIDSFQFMA